MVSLLVALAFAPLLLASTWMYMSPLSRLDGHPAAKVIVKIVLAAVVLGGGIAQLNFLGHKVPLSARSFWGLALLITEGIPILAVMFYRDYKNRSDYGSKR